LDVLVYSRDAPGTEALRADRDLLERHWSYMDGFAASMIARGPTFEADRETVTGSLHVLGLPDPDAARAFVAEEPNARAGVYGEHVVRRFDNLLGRTMWDFSGRAVEPLFLVLGPTGGPPPAPTRLPAALRDRLILYGALRTLEGGEPAGLALALQAETRQAVAALLAEAGLREAEIHDWEFGGRR
jgi:uncharacterized protein YciI